MKRDAVTGSRWDIGPGWRHFLKWMVWAAVREFFGQRWCDSCRRWFRERDMDDESERCKQCIEDPYCGSKYGYEGYKDSIRKQCAEAGRPDPYHER